jgi:hypothetical protein
VVYPSRGRERPDASVDFPHYASPRRIDVPSYNSGSDRPTPKPAGGSDLPAKNVHHDAVVRALTADGWTITHDPLRLAFGNRDAYVDLGAERAPLAAEKEGRKIAVEIHSFLAASPVHDLQAAVGQYEVYLTLLAELEPDRSLYLAVPRRAYDGILSERFGQLIVKNLRL